MFVTQAHSFTQQARLAITLALVAGYTNIVTVITCGTVSSHVSGTASALGREVVEGSWGLAGFSVFLLACFVVGAMVSAVCTELGRARRWESIYVLPIALEAAMLAGLAVLLEVYDRGAQQHGGALWGAAGVASGAMGLQNATITRISAGVVRTTHVTGVLTDLGLEAVQALRWALARGRGAAGAQSMGGGGAEVVGTHPLKRLALLASIIGSFVLGAGLGTWAHGALNRWVMFPPVLFLLWLVYRDLTTPVAELAPAKLSAEADGFALHRGIGLYHIAPDDPGQPRGVWAHKRRMPDLQRWIEALPSEQRVVVLDLGAGESFDAQALLELHAAVRTMERMGRTLVLAGLTPEQVRHARRADEGQFLNPSNLCPDVELAVARAIGMLG